MAQSRNQILTGTDEPPAAARNLQAGPLRVDFADGNLRSITWYGHEAIRGVSYLVRNENWGTYAPEISNLTIEENADAFQIRYDAACRSLGGPALRYAAKIEGSADGQLVFDVTATPDGDFLTNRCGFCILHPIVGVAGEPVEVEHVDGSVEQARFPGTIDPTQPFFSMRSITHTVTAGVTAACRMEGDAFEMEDQRNWTDASYKTYVRPLALPWPYTLPRDEANRQTITLSLRGKPAAPRQSGGGAVELTIAAPGDPLPAFGLVITPEETAATLAALDELAAVSPHHLILHYSPVEGHGADSLAGFARILAAHPVLATLEFTLPCVKSSEIELMAASDAVRSAGLRLDAIAVSPAPDLKSTPPGSTWPACTPLDEVYRAARAAFPGLTLGGGMFSMFTELNRKRPPAELIDFVTHTTSPIVHAADDRSVMETLEALPFVTRSVRAIFSDKPYRIGPSAIGMRQNPYGASLADNPGAARRVTMTADDPRQKGLFAAAWMIGYAAAVAEAGLSHLTLGALTGSFGLLGEGGRRPAFFAAQALAGLSGQPWVSVLSSAPDRVLALGTVGTVLVANLTSDALELRLPGMTRARLLDETTHDRVHADGALADTPVTAETLRLGGYGVAIATLRAT